MQQRDVLALGHRAGKLRLHLDDVGIGEPADQVDVVHGEIDHHADIRHARRKRTDAGDGDRKNILAADRFLDRLTAGLKRSTWPTISVTPALRAAAMMSRPSSTVEAIGFSTSTWMPRSMQVSAMLVMQMRRRRDRDGIDAELEQLFEVARPPGQPRTRVTRSRWPRSGSATPTSSTPDSPASTRAWFAPHDADADHADREAARSALHGLHHFPDICPRSPARSAPTVPSMARSRLATATCPQAQTRFESKRYSGYSSRAIDRAHSAALGAVPAKFERQTRPPARPRGTPAPRRATVPPAVLVPSAGSFFSTSAGAVMMWQPISSASITL